jgi:hypothetical protein
MLKIERGIFFPSSSWQFKSTFDLMAIIYI